MSSHCENESIRKWFCRFITEFLTHLVIEWWPIFVFNGERWTGSKWEDSLHIFLRCNKLKYCNNICDTFLMRKFYGKSFDVIWSLANGLSSAIISSFIAPKKKRKKRFHKNNNNHNKIIISIDFITIEVKIECETCACEGHASKSNQLLGFFISPLLPITQCHMAFAKQCQSYTKYLYIFHAVCCAGWLHREERWQNKLCL